MSAWACGPLLLQYFILLEKMAHFNRERIPEREVHAKGSWAFGTFTGIHDLTQYNVQLGNVVAKGLGVDVHEVMGMMKHETTVTV